MAMVRQFFYSCVLLIAVPSLLSAQDRDRCGTVEYSRSLYAAPQQQKLRFEQWLDERALRQQTSRRQRQQAPPYAVPVVVHVIHNGEPVGTGANLSDAQILSQLQVINEDFKRQNADAVNTPAEFQGRAGSLDLTFVLAKTDPDGVATDGIVRVNGQRSSWTMNDNYAMKSLSYWPAEQYLNIWVCNLQDIFVGYAQFPESTLPGLENSSTNRLTDGVVIWHRAFGSGPFNLDPDFNKGRTLTHELGHFFGLRHIWGDEPECNGTDYVNDTPNQARQTENCPSHPRTDSCGEVIMFQNYLDYTDDACMNLFTQGQVNRMVIVLENSPRRTSLLTSPGLQEPAPKPNDLGLRTLVFPDATVCDNQVTPLVELRNYGSNDVTSARIRLVLDGAVAETKDFTLSLPPQQSLVVAFSTLTLSSGTHSLSFDILLTNGVADGGTFNNSLSGTAIVPVFVATPVTEDFESPSPWIIRNPDGQITWEKVTAPKKTPSNHALKLNFFDYEDKEGEIDTYLSPVFSLSAAPAATLVFDVAYARYQASNDRLRVVVLTDCQDITAGTEVYNKAGDDLDTAPPTTNLFVPAGEQHWRREVVNLSAFIGSEKVQLAFIGINDWGNNLYLDNISLTTEKSLDAALLDLVTPSVVTCENPIGLTILVQNFGAVTIQTLEVVYSVNNGAAQTFKRTGLDLQVGQQEEIVLPAITFAEGNNTLTVQVRNPNDATDNNPTNDERAFTVVINTASDRIPFRENFEGDFTEAWTLVNPGGGMNWQTVTTNFGRSLYFNAFDNTLPGDEAWLVSPVLDFSRARQASMLFDMSYARRDPAMETLSVRVSRDCGTTFSEIPFNFPDVGDNQGSWLPAQATDWQRNIAVNLNSLAGEAQVRLAFVVGNQQGNNLYLDNIEFFTTADPDTIEIPTLYAVYGYDLANPSLSDLTITFNLPEKEEVHYSIISVTGQVVTEHLLTDVLNQTLSLGISQRLAPGIYFVRLRIGDRIYSTKILQAP